jgi:hypothetical protein
MKVYKLLLQCRPLLKKDTLNLLLLLLLLLYQALFE